MVKFRLFFDKDKEVEWLNKMSGEGYALTGFCMGIYTFDICQPGEYVYQVDFTEGLFSVSGNYREFMADAGVEIVCLWGWWVILRKKAAEGEFKLYTDVESSIGHYTKIRNMFKVVTIVELVCLLAEVFAAVRGVYAAKICACLLIVLIMVLIKEVMHLNGVLEELKARIGEAPEARPCGGRRRFSGFFIAGMLLNSVRLLMIDVLESGFGLVGDVLAAAAIILMAVGIWRTFRRLR